MSQPNSQDEGLEEEVEHILEEARMVLPGLQALFGFQLIAVFSDRFGHALGTTAQRLHLSALVMVALAIALIMAPAAYHRQAERGTVSRYLANYASALIASAMAPLLLALAVEIGVVTLVVTQRLWISLTLSPVFALVVGWLWYGFPALRKRSRRRRR